MCKEIQATESDSWRKHNFHVSLVSSQSFAGVNCFSLARKMVFTAKRQTFSLGKTDPLRALTHTAQNLEGDSLYAFCSIFVSICFVVFCCIFMCFIACSCALLRFVAVFFFCYAAFCCTTCCTSEWRRANARNISFITRYGGQFTFPT